MWSKPLLRPINKAVKTKHLFQRKELPLPADIEKFKAHVRKFKQMCEHRIKDWSSLSMEVKKTIYILYCKVIETLIIDASVRRNHEVCHLLLESYASKNSKRVPVGGKFS